MQSEHTPENSGDAECSPPKEKMPTGPIRDKEFWFEDGTVTLIAHDVEFRVYGGVLAKQSLVFRDMLSLPQPQGDAGDTTESNPSTCTLSDSPQDVRHLLRYFFPGHGDEQSLEPVLKVPTVCSLVRLAHKYEMEKLLGLSLVKLKALFPTALDVWGTRPGLPRLDQRLRSASAIEVVAVARLTETTDLLPGALLYCCELGAEIVRGFRREDGSVVRLSDADLARCFAAQGLLTGAVVLAAAKLVVGPETKPSCATAGACGVALSKLAEALILNPHVPPMTAWLSSGHMPVVDGVLGHMSSRPCSHCVEKVKANDRQARQKVWEQLPTVYFNVRVPTGWTPGG